MPLLNAVLLSILAGTVVGNHQVRQSRRAVVVELFTSEGCSSCPPADDLLARLVQRQPVKGVDVIGLSEHVDYWNSLGWRDPFSSIFFSTRQETYARNLGLNGSYTPQMVVDGSTEFLGSDEDRALQVISQRAGHRPASLSLTSETIDGQIVLNFDVAGPVQGADLMLAVTESGLRSHVLRGENSGRHLTHAAVVRELKRIGSVPQGGKLTSKVSVVLRGEWARPNLKAVLFLQWPKQGAIIAAASVDLGS